MNCIDLPNGQINNVFYVPNLSTIFLSIFQITHLGERKPIDFSPHNVVIRDLKDPSILTDLGHVEDSSRLCKFDKFEA
jgi:hypothetical protein